MVLGELIELLEQAPDITVKHGFNNPHSYRGYYEDVAFEPTENITTKEMLVCAREALGNTYNGYKGGDYKMSEWASCWISNYGESSEESIGKILLNYMISDQLDE